MFNSRFHYLLLPFLIIGASIQLQSSSLETETNNLLELSKVTPLIKLDKKDYKRYITDSPKTYSFILLAASSNCNWCEYALRELNFVAKSYRSFSYDSTKLFFGVAYIEDVPSVVEIVKFSSVPVLIYISPSGEPIDKIEMQGLGIQAEKIAKWIENKTAEKIRIIRPPNYFAAAMVLITFVLLIIMLHENGVTFSFIYDRNLWGAGCVLFCTAMSSGQMWNYIESPPPFNVNSQDAGLHLIHHSRRDQYLFETYLVMVLYIAITVGVILLINAGKNNRRKFSSSKFFAVAGILMVSIFSSSLFSIFKRKLQVYPFR